MNPRARWALARVLVALFIAVTVFALSGCTTRLPIGQAARYGAIVVGYELPASSGPSPISYILSSSSGAPLETPDLTK